MIPIEQCPVCGATALRPYSFARKRPGKLHWAQVRCAGCHLVISHPRASAEEISRYYRDDYYQATTAEAGAVDAHTRQLNERHEVAVMQELWADWPPPSGATAIDVGCGYGSMFPALRRLGYSVSGYEPGAGAVAYCRHRGYAVEQGMIEDIPDRRTYDLTMSLQVIEHVTDPRAFVQSLVALTRPGGIVVIATEDAWNAQYAWERIAAWLTGRLPPFRSATDHTCVFSAPHLERLLVDAGCDEVRSRAYAYEPQRESLHWRLYKGTFRLLDRLMGHGDWLMTVGRVKP